MARTKSPKKQKAAHIRSGEIMRHRPKAVRDCAYVHCPNRFKQKRPHQRFCSQRCCRAQWEHLHPRVKIVE